MSMSVLMPVSEEPRRFEVFTGEGRRRRFSAVEKAANRRHGTKPGRCIVVPLSASEPVVTTTAEVMFPAGIYRSLTVPTWAICSALTSVSHDRLDRVGSTGATRSRLGVRPRPDSEKGLRRQVVVI